MAPLNRYHPFRYAQTRPYARSLVSTHLNGCGAHPEMFSERAFREMAAIVQHGYNQALFTLPRDLRPRDSATFYREIHLGAAYTHWAANGRNIFAFDPRLVAMFDHTDASDIPMNMLRMPYDSIYLAFGPREDIRLGTPSVPVDGAYVRRERDTLFIHLTTCRARAEGDEPRDFIVHPDIDYHLRIPWVGATALGQAIDQALADEIQVHKAPPHIAEMVEDMRESGREVTSSAERTAAETRANLLAGQSSFHRAMNLVVNALCYLTAYPEEPSLEWPEGTPERLAAQADTAPTAKARLRAEQKLLPLGFTRVRFCRLRGHHAVAEAAGTGAGKRAHLRRGHWRRIRFGPKRASQYLGWIMPVMVNRDAPAAVEGHIYDVSPSPHDLATCGSTHSPSDPGAGRPGSE